MKIDGKYLWTLLKPIKKSHTTWKIIEVIQNRHIVNYNVRLNIFEKKKKKTLGSLGSSSVAFINGKDFNIQVKNQWVPVSSPDNNKK